MKIANYTAARVAHLSVDAELEAMAMDILSADGRSPAGTARPPGETSPSRVMNKLRDWDVSRNALLDAWGLMTVAQRASCKPLPPDFHQAILF
jgi:hypothetical protein